MLGTQVLRMLKSEWIAFLDSDDVWYQNKIEKQLLSYNSSKKSIILFTQMKFGNLTEET